MIVKGKETIYPYLKADGNIHLKTFHSNDIEYYGLCLVERGSGIPLEYEVSVETAKNANHLAVLAFDGQIEKIRAKMEMEIEALESAKQSFIALESSL